MELKSCGILKNEGISLAYADTSSTDNLIKWGNVDNNFKSNFMEMWNTAMEYNENDDNRGMNILALLDHIGYLINNSEIEEAFDEVYDHLIQQGINEMD